MAQTALFMAPMARKKRVTQKYSPNSYRVISSNAESFPLPPKPTDDWYRVKSDFNILGQTANQPTPRSSKDHRHNRPNPNAVGFLRQDVRLLNEPVCNVFTSSTRDEQHSWWPSRVSEDPLHKPAHTLDTTMRQDFQYKDGVKGSARHTFNPNSNAVRGAVPVNNLREADGSQRVWKEAISYEHQYNSRAEPSYPIRAKRHGSFVWDQLSKADLAKLLNQNGYGIESAPAISSRKGTENNPSYVGQLSSAMQPLSAPPNRLPPIPTQS